MIKKLHHGCITVSDMERSLAFYRDKLGLKVQMDFEMFGPEFDAYLKMSGARFRIVYFEEGVELVQYVSPSLGKKPDITMFDFGFAFLIFEVDDIQKTYEEWSAKGVEFYGLPRLPEKEVPTVGKVMLVHLPGPDGERISLNQHLS